MPREAKESFGRRPADPTRGRTRALQQEQDRREKLSGPAGLEACLFSIIDGSEGYARCSIIMLLDSGALIIIQSTMGYLRFLVYPLLGAFVGYITNYLAIKLLFRPKRRVLGIQGLLPKRKAEIAKRAGEVVNSYLVNREAIRLKIDTRRLDEGIDRFLHRGKIP